MKTNVRDARSTSPAHLDLHGKTPVLTYADRRMVSVSMVTTDDAEFVRWDVDGRLPCYQYRPDGQPIADASYPVSVAVGPHRRLHRRLRDPPGRQVDRRLLRRFARRPLKRSPGPCSENKKAEIERHGTPSHLPGGNLAAKLCVPVLGQADGGAQEGESLCAQWPLSSASGGTSPPGGGPERLHL